MKLSVKFLKVLFLLVSLASTVLLASSTMSYVNEWEALKSLHLSVQGFRILSNDALEMTFNVVNPTGYGKLSVKSLGCGLYVVRGESVEMVDSKIVPVDGLLPPNSKVNVSLLFRVPNARLVIEGASLELDCLLTVKCLMGNVPLRFQVSYPPT
jgi:hypothetical protein